MDIENLFLLWSEPVFWTLWGLLNSNSSFLFCGQVFTSKLALLMFFLFISISEQFGSIGNWSVESTFPLSLITSRFTVENSDRSCSLVLFSCLELCDILIDLQLSLLEDLLTGLQLDGQTSSMPESISISSAPLDSCVNELSVEPGFIKFYRKSSSMTIEITKLVACYINLVLLVSMFTWLILAKIKRDSTIEIFFWKKF